MSRLSHRHNLARGLTLVASLFLGAMSVAQTTTPAAAKKPHGRKAILSSRLDIMGGYALFEPVNSGIGAYSYSPVGNMNTTASLAGYWGRRWGFQAEGGYFSGPSKRDVLGQCAPSCSSRDQNVYTAEIGPIYRFQLSKGFVPFVHVLGGGAKINGPALQSLSWGWATTGGAGIDYVLPILHDHLAVRLAQVDYQFSHVDYGPLAPNGLTGGIGNLSAYKLTTGVVLRLGDMSPKQTATLACEVEPAAVLAGEPVKLTTTARGLNPKRDPMYTLTSTGGIVKQDAGSAEVDTTGLAPGSYTLSAKVSQGAKPYEQAHCAASFAINAPPPPDEPPTISCSASPASVTRGEQTTLTAVAVSPQHHALTYSYSAPAGQITGTDATATLDTTGVPVEALAVTCSVSDDTGKTASATTVVQVTAAEMPPAPKTRNLCSVSFERDRKRPVRVDNEAKGCLDDIALQLNRETDSTLIVIGDFAGSETRDKGSARAEHVKQYLVDDKGIEANRIRVRSTKSTTRSAETVLVPAGATFEDTESEVVQ